MQKSLAHKRNQNSIFNFLRKLVSCLVHSAVSGYECWSTHHLLSLWNWIHLQITVILQSLILTLLHLTSGIPIMQYDAQKYYNLNQLNALLLKFWFHLSSSTCFRTWWSLSRQSVVEYTHYGTMLGPSTCGVAVNYQRVLCILHIFTCIHLIYIWLPFQELPYTTLT